MRLPIFAYSGPRDWALVALAALVLALLPIVFDDPFFILVMQSLGYLFIATLGLDILVGWTGQISLGHAGLYAVGAYTSALAATRLGLPFWLSAPLGVTLAGLFGVALAVPSLRARGPYLAMVTIAFGFMAEVTSNRWSLTGGPMGIMSIPAPTLPDGSEMTARQYFWLIAGVALICQLLAANLFRARLGRTLLALQGSEIAAQSVGINVYRYKVLAFVISSVYAGIGGVFFAHQNGFINSDTFVFSLSVSFLTSALMGGTGTLLGPLVGSVILNLIPTVFASLQEYQLYIYGGIILITIVFLPKGIVGSLRQTSLLRRWQRPPVPIEADAGVLDFARGTAGSEPVRRCAAQRRISADSRVERRGRGDRARQRARPDRPERLRQEHFRQRGDGRVPAERRHDHPRRQGPAPAGTAPHGPLRHHAHISGDPVVQRTFSHRQRHGRISSAAQMRILCQSAADSCGRRRGGGVPAQGHGAPGIRRHRRARARPRAEPFLRAAASPRDRPRACSAAAASHAR
jgi:ABC-type branched-subunit amino acid transport system permease subunit